MGFISLMSLMRERLTMEHWNTLVEMRILVPIVGVEILKHLDIIWCIGPVVACLGWAN